jgi:tetratricopeptide (TPR) repeat protein
MWHFSFVLLWSETLGKGTICRPNPGQFAFVNFWKRRAMTAAAGQRLERPCNPLGLLAGAWLVALLVACSGCSLWSKARGPCRKMSLTAASSRNALLAPCIAVTWRLPKVWLNAPCKTNPQDAQAHQNYSEALWRTGQREAAIAQAQEAQKLLPDDPLVTVRLGEQYQEQGRSQEAAELASQAIDICPICASGWALRARARASLGQMNNALPDYQQALRYQPNDQKLLLELAELHRRMNRPERALATLGSLRETYPAGEEPPQLLVLEADAFAALGRWPQSVRARTQLAQKNANSRELAIASHGPGTRWPVFRRPN